MTNRAVKVGLLPLLAGMLAIPLFAAPAAADAPAAAQARGAAPSDGYKTAVRLGGGRSLYWRCRGLGSEAAQERCLGTRALLQRAGKDPRFQKDLSRVMDDAGMTSQTAEIIRLLSEAPADAVQEVNFEVGRTMEWMGLWDTRLRPARPARVQMIRWGGKKPFKAWQFTVDDGTRVYTYVVPKECGNLGLASVVDKPKPPAAKPPEPKPDDSAARRAEEERRKREEEERQQAELRREPSCAVSTTATYAKGVWTFAIDGSASASGTPAAAMTVQIIDPAGKPVSVTSSGAATTELKLTPPFRADVTARKLKSGTYTVRAVSTRNNNVAPNKTCEATVTLARQDNVDFFVDGTFGKQRRQLDMVSSTGEAIQPGFCDPQLALKGGPLFWFAEGKASFAPAVGLAFNFGSLDDDLDFDPNEYNNVSMLAEAVVNYHFQPRGAYIGTGFGWWDIFDGDHNTGAWVVNFGVPMSDSDKGTLLFIGEGRLFFSGEQQDSNYNLGAGVRYIFK